jgi:hypothetical protein
MKGCTLPRGKKGLKAQRVKVARKELKSNFETFEMLRPGIPKKAVKNFSVRKGDPQDNINTQGTS